MEHFFFWCSNLGALGFAGFVIIFFFFSIMFSKQTVSCSFCFPLLLLLLFQYVYCLGTLYNSPYIDFFISHRIILKNGKKEQLYDTTTDPYRISFNEVF